MLLLILFIVIFGFIIYLIYDLASTNVNAFFDKWAKKTLFLWLPFYALWRLTREMFQGKR